jgi:hypothetical protein
MTVYSDAFLDMTAHERPTNPAGSDPRAAATALVSPRLSDRRSLPTPEPCAALRIVARDDPRHSIIHTRQLTALRALVMTAGGA